MPAKFNFRPERVTGEHGNAWNDKQTGAAGVSNIVDVGHCTNVSMFGHVDGDSEIDFYISQNGVDFFKCATISAKLPGASGGAKDFHVWEKGVGGRYIRLTSSLNVTATVTIAAKT